MKKIKTTIAFAFLTVLAMAQSVEITKPDKTDFMRADGKIMVVATVILIIMAGFFSYLISVDRKLTKLEKEGIK